MDFPSAGELTTVVPGKDLYVYQDVAALLDKKNTTLVTCTKFKDIAGILVWSHQTGFVGYRNVNEGKIVDDHAKK